MNSSSPAASGAHVSLRFSTTSPNRTHFHPLRANSGSLAQWGLGWSGVMPPPPPPLPVRLPPLMLVLLLLMLLLLAMLFLL